VDKVRQNIMQYNFITNIMAIRTAFISLVLFCLPAFAGVPTPDIPKGKGEKCVEETEFMRKNHMELILHQRDETVHKGIRTKKHSFKECINCHAVKGDDNVPVSFKNPKHFCNSCHTFAAVKIDCFECHASRPDNDKLDHDRKNNAAMSKH